MINEISNQVKKALVKKCDEYEIYISQSESIELGCEKTEVNFAKEEIESGIGIRVLKDKKLGFAFTSDLTKIQETAEQAISNTKLNKADTNFAFAQNDKVRKINQLYDKKFENMDLDEPIDYIKNMINQVDKKCEITSAGYAAIKEKYHILNSNDVSISDTETCFNAYISVNTKKDNTCTAFDSVTSRFFDFDEDKFVNDVCNIALNSLEPKPINSGNKEIILDYNALRDLLPIFISALNSENVQREKSKLKDKLGQQVVNENLTIIDDGTLTKGLGSGKCDGEGTISQKTTLIEDGELKTFIYDIYNANKENCSSTGNGFRGSYSSTPSVTSSNIIFDYKDEINIEDIKNGIQVTSVLGAHTANLTSGDFSVEVSNAFNIENGEIKDPIKKAMISGNIFELLKTGTKIKSETKQKGNYIIPKVLMHDLRVTGKN